MLFKLKHLILFTIIIFSLCSCDPLKHAIRKHDRLVERFPTLHKKEFVTFHDTLILKVSSVEHDTIVHQDFDTVIINKDRLKVKVIHVKDSIYIQGECDSIYVEKIVEKKIPVIYYPEENKTWNWIWWILIGLFCLGVLYIVLNRKKRKDERNIG